MSNRFTLRRLVAIVTALGMIGADAKAITQLKSFVWTKDDCETEDAEVKTSGQQIVFQGTPGVNGTATFACVGGTAEIAECDISEAGNACSIAGAFDASACHGITVNFTLTPSGTTPSTSTSSTSTSSTSSTPSTTTTPLGGGETSSEPAASSSSTGSSTTSSSTGNSVSSRRLTTTTVTYCFGESSVESSVCSAGADPGPVDIGQPKEDHIQETVDGSSQAWKELTDCPASDTPSPKPSEPQSGSVAAKISAASVLLSLIAAV